MVGEPSSEGHSSQEREPPHRRPSIIRVFRALKRYENQHRRRTKQEKSDRDLIMARWTRRVGIFTAALVAVGIGTGLIFWWQLGAMQGQLDEMKATRLMTIAQTRANLRWEKPAVNSVDEKHQVIGAGQPLAGWEISPMWTNVASTDARNFRYSFDIQSFDVGVGEHVVIGSDKCPAFAELPDNGGSTVANQGVMVSLAKFLPVGNAVAALDSKKYIIMWCQTEYKDIFFPQTQVHHDKWCVNISPGNISASLFSFIFLIQDVD